MIRSLLFVALVTATCGASHGQVLTGQVELGYATVSKEDETRHASAVQIGAESFLTDVFAVGSAYQLIQSEWTPLSAPTHRLSLFGIFALDVFAYIPWIAAGAAIEIGRPLSPSLDFRLGADKLVSEDWSVGLALGAERPLQKGRLYRAVHGMVRVGYRFSLMDEFAP